MEACADLFNSFSHLSEWNDHMVQAHSHKFMWTCKLCGSRKFAAKSQLQYHAESIHYIPAEAAMGLCELWQDKVVAQEEETECVFCNERYGTQDFARVSHLGRHMVEIALLGPVSVLKQTAPLYDSTATELYQNLSLLPKQVSTERPQKAVPGNPESMPASPPEEDLQQESLENISRESNSSRESDSEAHDEVVEDESMVVEHVSFTLEELSSDPGYDSDIEIVQPDSIEHPKEKSPTLSHIIRHAHDTRNSSDEEERQRIYRRKKKRWSAGIFKRSHSQSVGSDSDYSDNEPLDEAGSSARRLRRRVRGPLDRRSSLIFEDGDFREVDGIKEGRDKTTKDGQEGVAEDNSLEELPFWDEEPRWEECD
jgi:hypothetical protein